MFVCNSPNRIAPTKLQTHIYIIEHMSPAPPLLYAPPNIHLASSLHEWDVAGGKAHQKYHTKTIMRHTTAQTQTDAHPKPNPPYHPFMFRHKTLGAHCVAAHFAQAAVCTLYVIKPNLRWSLFNLYQSHGTERKNQQTGAVRTPHLVCALAGKCAANWGTTECTHVSFAVYVCMHA